MLTTNRKPGIYKITNTVNGKFYIGSTVRAIRKRWWDHQSSLRTGTHPNIHLQRSVTKNGLEVFVWEVLENTEWGEDVILLEQKYLDELKPHYNINPTARSSAGVKRSEETRRKIGLSKMGNKNNLGRIKTEEELQNISAAVRKAYAEGFQGRRGAKWSQASVDQLSTKLKGNSRRKDNPTYSGFKQLDKTTGKIIAEFSTSRQAADAVGRFDKPASSKIIRACRTGNVAYGYKWFSESVQVKPGELLEACDGNQQPS